MYCNFNTNKYDFNTPLDCPEYERYVAAFDADQQLLARDLGRNACQTGSAKRMLGGTFGRGAHAHQAANYCGISVFEAPGSERPDILVECRDASGQVRCLHKATATKAGLKIEQEEFTPGRGTIRNYGVVSREYLEDYRPRGADQDFGTCRQDYREDGIGLVCDFVQSLENGDGMKESVTRSFTEGAKRRFYNEYPAELTQTMYGKEATPPIVQLMTVDYQVQNSYANLLDPMYIVWYILVCNADMNLTKDLMMLAFHSCRDVTIDHLLSITAQFIRAFAKHAPGTLSRMARDNNMFIGPQYIHDEQMLIPWVMDSGNADILAEVVTYLSRWNAICGEKRVELKSLNGTTDQRFNLDAYIQGNYLGGERTLMTIPIHFNKRQLFKLVDRPLNPKDIQVIRNALAPCDGTNITTFRENSMKKDLTDLVVRLAEVLDGLTDCRSSKTLEHAGTCVNQILYLRKNSRYEADFMASDVSRLIRFVSVVFDAGYNTEGTVAFFAAAQMKVFASSAILNASEMIPRSSPYMSTFQRSAKILSLLKDGRTLPNVFSSASALEAVLEPLCGMQHAHAQFWVPFGETSPSLNSAIRSRVQFHAGRPCKRSVATKSTKTRATFQPFQIKSRRTLGYSTE